MITKTFFLAKSFQRIGIKTLRENKSLRDHEPPTRSAYHEMSVNVVARQRPTFTDGAADASPPGEIAGATK
jgi:hypothetical protein